MGDVIELMAAKAYNKVRKSGGDTLSEIERMTMVADCREKLMTRMIADNFPFYESLVAMQQIINAGLMDACVSKEDLDKDAQYYN